MPSLRVVPAPRAGRSVVLLLLPLLALLAGAALGRPAVAHARVLAVADGSARIQLVDLHTMRPLAQVEVPGGTRDLAFTHDGTRLYAAAGLDVVVIDPSARKVVGYRAFPTPPRAVAAATTAQQLVVGRGRSLFVLNAANLATVTRVRLERGATVRRVAVDASATRAVVDLGRRGVAVVDLPRRRVIRRLRTGTPGGITLRSDGATALIAVPPRHRGDHGTLYVVRTSDGQVRDTIRLPRDVGGGVSSPVTARRVVVGAARGGKRLAVVDVARGRVTHTAAVGHGPGLPAVADGDTRVFVGDAGSRSLSLVPFATMRRTRAVRLPGRGPTVVAAQPGLAVQGGTAGNDRLRGTRGADKLLGFVGADDLRGRRDRDELYGGPGDDRLSGGPGQDLLDGGPDNDTIFGGNNSDTVRAGPGDDHVYTSHGNDQIDLGPGNDDVDPGDGDDTVRGGPGNDRIVESGLGNDVLLDGGDGNDVIDGNRGTDHITGGNGDDIIQGGNANDTLDGGAGRDRIFTGTGNDRVDAGADDDTVVGDIGKNRIRGGEGNDSLDGNSGKDRIYGEQGDDGLIGGPGRDRLSGGPGNDVIRAADNDKDRVDCGAGIDTVFVESTAPHRDRLRHCEHVYPIPPEPGHDVGRGSYTFFGKDGDDVIGGTAGIDTIIGNGGDDTLYGQAGGDYVDGEDGDDEVHGGPGNDDVQGRKGNDVLFGNEDDDRVQGASGDDTVDGGPGKDTIIGGSGNDKLIGGPGDDHIEAVDGSIDRISCGPGYDKVKLDLDDVVVGHDCERLIR